jgi:putative glycosyltransferase (TIGR04348 family)
MRIQIVTPAPPGSRKGNRITAERWVGFLRQFGHDVHLTRAWRGGPCDLLVALHARKSASSIQRLHRERPQVPIVLALTGTDVYDEIQRSQGAQRALELADQLIVLQPLAIRQLSPGLRSKARVIYQSCPRVRHRPRRRTDVFEVCVLGHLRRVKDPFRAPLAARLLPESSRIRILHLGAPLTAAMAKRACAEMAVNPRYRWLGDVPRGRALQLLARCRLLVLSSLLEGGANVISEALVTGTPVLASRIDGSLGLLGTRYPGFFPVRDTQALTDLLWRAETEPAFYRRIDAWCRRLRPRFSPVREKAAWRALLSELHVL